MACENLKRIKAKLLKQYNSRNQNPDKIEYDKEGKEISPPFKPMAKDVLAGLKEKLQQVDRDINSCMKKEDLKRKDQQKKINKITGIKPKKTGGFKDNWLEPPCCPEI